MSSRETIFTRFAIVVGLIAVAAFFSTPPKYFGENDVSKWLSQFQVTLGLDLAGGTELDYKIDLSDAIAQNADDDQTNNVDLDRIAESVRDALERRVNPAGVGEILVKRSQVDQEEHVLIQMPPSSNVEQAKAEASRDNRLDFFAENPALETEQRAEFEKIREKINGANWATEIEKLKKRDDVLYQDSPGARFVSEIPDPSIKDKLLATPAGQLVTGLVDTMTEAETRINEAGSLELVSYPQQVVAMIRVTEKFSAEKDKTTPAEAEARHILFAYPGATRAADDVRYADAETAKAEAQKVLEQLKTGGVDSFGELVKEYSTEPGAETSGGELGSFGKGVMAKPFEEAVFAQAAPGLIAEVIESDFGFHIIEVQKFSAEKLEKVQEMKIGYEMLGWKSSELGWEATELGGAQLELADVSYNELGNPNVALLFNSEGIKLFADMTSELASRKCAGEPCLLGVKVGDQWQTRATVTQKIVGNAIITGNFTYESARNLADRLNLGAIDAPVQLSGQMTIKPELGADQLSKSLKAAALGFAMTLLFMVLSYRMAGIVAGIALALYAGLFVLVLKLWPESFGGPVVLSLSGMAGIALSIGLAVDGNILIFERMKEEMNAGRSIHKAVDLGFERAWSAIKDSNLTTLLTCVILYNLGSSMIRGFAVTLIVGTLLSMFTAVTVSRTLLHTFLLAKPLQASWLWGFKKSRGSK